MKSYQGALYLSLSALFVLACAPKVSSNPQASTQSTPTASPSVQRVDASLGKHALKLELAKTEQEQQLGLMFRKSMPENQGMLFVFQKEQTLSFWMKNTLIPLSIAYLDKSLKIIDIQDMKPLDLTPHPSKKPAQFALELNQGWFKKHGVKEGTALMISKEHLSLKGVQLTD